MDRRRFLKQVSLWSAGLLVTPPVFNITPDLFASLDDPSQLFVAKGTGYQAMTENIVNAMGGRRLS